MPRGVGLAALLCVILCRVINMASVSELLGPILYTRTINWVSQHCADTTVLPMVVLCPEPPLQPEVDPLFDTASHVDHAEPLCALHFASSADWQPAGRACMTV